MGILMLLLILLLLWFYFSQQAAAGKPDGQVATALDATETADQPSQPSEVDQAEAKPVDEPAQQPAKKPEPSSSRPPSLDVDEETKPPGEQADQMENRVVDELPMLSPPSDQGPRLGAFSLNRASLFGVEVVAEKVAYVIDYSSSMQGSRLRRAKKELVESVDRLTPQQTVTVVLFNSRAYTNPDVSQQSATSKTKAKLANWLDQTLANGGTDPLPAMERVLREEFDVIFLVSDGEFNLSDVNRIRQLNKKKIPISSISLNVDSQTLKMVAEQNDGQYINVK